MCDQDHFDNDREEYEARGLVTRRQFGMLLGAPPSRWEPSAQITLRSQMDFTLVMKSSARP